MEKFKNTRFNYIDIARGIALFFVILGHLVQFDSNVFNWIFSFHIPLFFIISGMCYELKEQPSFIEYLNHKVKTLLIPYGLFLIFGFIISYCTSTWRAGVISKNALMQAFYYVQPEVFHVGQIWFLVALFISSIFLYLANSYIIDKIKNNKYKNIANMILIILFIIIFLVSKNTFNINNRRLPWKIDVAFMGVAFMLFGCLIGRNNIIKKIKQYKALGFMIVILLGIINYLFGVNSNGYVNICDCIYGVNIGYYFISAVSGSMVMLAISCFISRNKILEYYGKNSLFMFAIHSMLLYQAQFMISKICKTDYYIMTNIPIGLCIILAIIIYVLLGFVTFIYNYFKNKIIDKKTNLFNSLN